MTPYIRWSKPRQPRELLCIKCGAVRDTLHLPRLQMDPVTRTLLPLLALARAVLREQKPHLFEDQP